ncbi:MAG: hypothetical protein SPE33_09595 [[Pasteurella] aerogenes]|nr:hypothetical protein [[Pasteurella] aerogenes]
MNTARKHIKAQKQWLAQARMQYKEEVKRKQISATSAQLAQQTLQSVVQKWEAVEQLFADEQLPHFVRETLYAYQDELAIAIESKLAAAKRNRQVLDNAYSVSQLCQFA